MKILEPALAKRTLLLDKPSPVHLKGKYHSLNERSRRAALRMGFQFEGIQESHMIVKNCNRDTAWFRILDHEWPNVEQNLQNMLYGDKR